MLEMEERLPFSGRAAFNRVAVNLLQPLGWSEDQDCERHWELIGNAVRSPSPVLLSQKLHFTRSSH